MQIKALETFLCVADTGGFLAAARKLNVTQTAVSARIRLIEDETGKQLFTRGAGGTALTEFGRQFKPYAEQMLSLWSFASTDLPAQTQDRLALRLGAQLSIWDPLLVDLAVRFERLPAGLWRVVVDTADESGFPEPSTVTAPIDVAPRSVVVLVGD